MSMHHLIKRSVTAAVVVTAAGFPSVAQARYAEDPPLSSASTPAPVVSGPSAQRTSSGFQWGDAGLGAAGATVLLGAGVLGASVTRRRRPVVG